MTKVKKAETDNNISRSIGRLMADYKDSPGSLILRLLIIVASAVTIGVTLWVILYILIKGIPNIHPELFEWKYNSQNVSMMPSIINTLLMTGLALLFAVPSGVGAAVYLVEYARRGSGFVKIIRMAAETLAGIPSIVYGLFGFLLFAVAMGLGYSLLGGALTLAIMILPVIMRTTEEALIAVPDTYREGSFGLGAGKTRTIFRIILPSAVPGILSGIILGIGRAAGETAALLFTAGSAAEVAASLSSSCRTLAVHMYVLISEGLYVKQAYATAVILLIMVVIINLFSSLVAKKIEKTGE